MSKTMALNLVRYEYKNETCMTKPAQEIKKFPQSRSILRNNVRNWAFKNED